MDELLKDKVFSIFDSEEHYIACALLWLDTYPEAIGPHGAIVAVPARGAILSLPITGITIMDSLPALLKAHVDMYQDLPGTISVLPYWYHDGELEPFRMHEEEDGNTQLLTGEKLSALILELAKAHLKLKTS